MDRRTLVRRAAERLPAETTVAVYPDHPFVMQPPEILAAREGALYAVFALQAQETLGRGRHAYARYLLNRLALPSAAIFVAALEDPVDIETLPPDFFDGVLLTTEQRSHRIPGDPAGTEWHEATDGIRMAHIERFGSVWATGSAAREKRARRDPNQVTTSSLTMRRRPSRRRRSPYLHSTGQNLVLEAPRESRQKLMSLVAAAALAAVDVDYGLASPSSTQVTDAAPTGATLSLMSGRTPARNRRYPALHQEPPTQAIFEYGDLLRRGDAVLALHQAHVSLVAPKRSFDIEKPLRAAAFAGFVPDLRPPFDDDAPSFGNEDWPFGEEDWS